MPEVEFETTSECVAIPASGTAIFLPVKRLLSVNVLILVFEGAKRSSVTAKVPIISPDINLGRISCLTSSSAYLIIASVNK